MLEAFDIPATYYQQCAYIVKNHTKQAHLSDLLEEVTLKNKETLTKTIPKEQFLLAMNSKKELTSVDVLSQIRAMIASEVRKVVNQEKEKAFGVSFWSRFSIPIFENGAVRHIAVPEGIYQLYALTDPSFSNNSGEGPASILKQISDICEKRKEISFFDRVLQFLGLGGRSDETADTYNGILKSLPH